MNRKRGFTLIELLVVMAIIALLIGLLLPALAKARAQAKLLKDGTQIKEIHQAWVAFAGENEGVLPTPGLFMRQQSNPDGRGLRVVPGRGKENVQWNHTGFIHSLCIMQNFYSPEICVGPTEPNANVYVLDDYDWEQYNVEDGIYWDFTFQSKLESRCNVSYSSMPLASGRRKTVNWRDTSPAGFILIGNRGPENGECEQESHITYEIHGGRKQWVGNMVYADNHLETLKTCIPEGLNYEEDGDDLADNIFDEETSDRSHSERDGFGWDVWNAMVSRVAGNDAGTEVLTFSWD